MIYILKNLVPNSGTFLFFAAIATARFKFLGLGHLLTFRNQQIKFLFACFLPLYSKTCKLEANILILRIFRLFLKVYKKQARMQRTMGTCLASYVAFLSKKIRKTIWWLYF